MLNKILSDIYERDLGKVKTELAAYTDEAKIWQVGNGISNSSGNLTLHIIGNLNHFIGAILGNTGYVRDRDSEFSLKNIPSAQMIAEIDKTIAVIRSTLGKLTPEDLEKIYPQPLPIGEVTTGFFMVNLIAHLDYHLGQINYCRRLLG